MKNHQSEEHVSAGSSRYEEDESAFLRFLEEDIEKGNVMPLAASWIERIHNLVGDVDIELDSEIEGDVDLDFPPNAIIGASVRSD